MHGACAGRAARRALTGAAAAGALAGTVASAHVAVSTTTLSRLCAAADLVVRARVLDAGAAVVVDDPPARRPAVVVEVIERLAGATDGDTLRFVQHGHGVADYAAGERVLLFLRDVTRSRELDALTEGGVRWVSGDAHAPKVLADAAGVRVAAVRTYLAALATPDPEARVAAFGRATVELLASPDAEVATSALRDLLAVPGAPWLTPADVPRLLAIVCADAAPLELRTGLLVELGRRGWTDAGGDWLHLLRTTSGADRRAVVAATRAVSAPAVTAAVVDLLGGKDVATAVTAAVALGRPRHDAAVAPLCGMLMERNDRRATAAVRALGLVGTETALECLRRAALRHADVAVRRRAAAEVTILAGRVAAATAAEPMRDAAAGAEGTADPRSP